MEATRAERTEGALFRGGSLTLENLEYSRAVRTFLSVLVKADVSPEDLTASALGMKERPALVSIVAREGGVAAGLAEFAFLLRSHGVTVRFEKQDGDAILPGDTLLYADGDESTAEDERDCHGCPLHAGAGRPEIVENTDRGDTKNPLGPARQTCAAFGQRRDAPARAGR